MKHIICWWSIPNVNNFFPTLYEHFSFKKQKLGTVGSHPHESRIHLASTKIVPKIRSRFGAQIGSPDRKELSEEGDEVGAVGRTAGGPIRSPKLSSFLIWRPHRMWNECLVGGFLVFWETDRLQKMTEKLGDLVNYYVIYYPDLGLRWIGPCEKTQISIR